MTRPAQPRRSSPTPAKTSELCVQIRPKIAATAKIKHAESYFTSHKVPNTPRGHNHPTVLQERLCILSIISRLYRGVIRGWGTGSQHAMLVEFVNHASLTSQPAMS